MTVQSTRRPLDGGQLLNLGAIAVGAIALYIAASEYMGDSGQTGLRAGTMPIAFAALLILAPLPSVLGWLRGSPELADHGPDNGPDNAPGDGPDEAVDEVRPFHRGAVATLTYTFAALLLTRVTGLVIALGVLVFVIVAVVEQRPIRNAVIASVGTSVTVWLLFESLLDIPLPSPIWAG